MTRFGPRIEPITSPTPGGYATSYATDAGLSVNVKVKLDGDAGYNRLVDDVFSRICQVKNCNSAATL